MVRGISGPAAGESTSYLDLCQLGAGTNQTLFASSRIAAHWTVPYAPAPGAQVVAVQLPAGEYTAVTPGRLDDQLYAGIQRDGGPPQLTLPFP